MSAFANRGAIPASTPGSEKASVYYDADSGNIHSLAHANDNSTQNYTRPSDGGLGADVNRNPSVAAGAMNQREGILNNKQDMQDNGFQDKRNIDGQTGIRDSGYASGHSANDKNAVAFEQPGHAYHDKCISAVPRDAQGATEFQGDRDYQGAGQTHGFIGTRDFNQGPNDVQGNRGFQEPSNGQYSQTLPQRAISLSRSEKERSAAGAFAGGAAVTGPIAKPEDDIVQQQRSATAESHLDDQTLRKITKDEAKDSKQLAKIIKAEGEAQKQSLSVSYKQLAKIQKIQKQASADESKALKEHGKATQYTHKMHSRYLDAKAAWEKAEANEKAKADQLKSCREHAQKTTENLAAKSKECEELRRIHAVDAREREAKLAELAEVGKAGKRN